MTATDIRKAAQVLRSLPDDVSQLLLARLDLEQAAAARAAIEEIGPLSETERQTALTTLATRLADVADETHASRLEPFAPLCCADIATLRTVLSAERTQTVALVLSYLPAEMASELLHTYPAELQSELIDRIRSMREVDREIVAAVEGALVEAMARAPIRHLATIDGPAAAAGILAFLDQQREPGHSDNWPNNVTQPATDANLSSVPPPTPRKVA